jgi:hypothetical protein
MPKVVLAPLAFSWGHIGRTLALADLLPKYLERIVLLPPGKISFIRKFNYATFTVPEISEQDLYQRFPDQLAKYREILLKLRPDILVTDNDPFALLAAHALNIRTVEIMTPLSLAGQLSLNKLLLPPQFSDLFLKLRKGYSYLQLKKFISRKNRILIPSIPHLEKVKFKNSKFTGPLFWKGWETLPTPSRSRRLEIGFSSSATGRGLFATFGSAPVPGKILKYLKQYCAQNGVGLSYSKGLTANRRTMAQADLVICHGGHQTVLEALSQGKPLICLPYNEDQRIVSRKVQELKCGLMLTYPAQLPAALRTVSTDELYFKNCQKLQKAMCSFKPKAIRIT